MVQPFGWTALTAPTPVRGVDAKFLEFGHLGGTPELSHRFRTVQTTVVELLVVVKDEREHTRFSPSRGQQGQILTCQAGLLGLDSSGIREMRKKINWRIFRHIIFFKFYVRAFFRHL